MQYLHFPRFWSAFYHSTDLRCGCGNMRKDSRHVVCCFDQSASFSTFDSAFYFPHSAFYPQPLTTVCNLHAPHLATACPTTAVT